MTIEEQKKMVEQDKASAKSDKIFSILFVAAFLTAPTALIGYNVYDFVKDKYEAKVKQEKQKEIEKANTLKTSVYIMHTVRGK